MIDISEYTEMLQEMKDRGQIFDFVIETHIPITATINPINSVQTIVIDSKCMENIKND